MKLSQAKEYLPFVQAAAEGKTIQTRSNGGDWFDRTAVDFNNPPSDYRIKPTKRLRAWRAEEAPVGAILERKGESVRAVLVGVSKTYAYLGYPSAGYTFDELLSNWTHDGGRPCGVEEES